jgi:hypothetical protein
LNSDAGDGITNSKEIAPQIAAAIGGYAHGVEEAQKADDPTQGSDLDPAVQKVVKVLDDLGIEHTAPVASVPSGAVAMAATYDITINGFDAGINIFDNATDLTAWQSLSDAFGGVSVTFDTAALSLNSDAGDGVANSKRIAPQIAAAIGGKAHGV